MVGVVGVRRLDGNLRALLRFGQGEGAVGCTGDFFAVGQPLVFDFAQVNAVLIRHLRDQGFAHFGNTADGDVAFVVGRRRRGVAVGYGIGCRTGRAFVVFGVVVVGRLHRNLRAFLRGGQGEGAVGRAANRLAVGKPLVFDAGRRYAVVVCYGRFQFATHFGFASNGDFAFVVARLRVGVRIGIRVRRRIVRVVLHVDGDGFGVAAAVAVVGGDLQVDGFFARVVEVLSGFEF